MDVAIETERLQLRPLQEADVPAIVASLNDWDVTRWLTVVPFPYSGADAAEWLATVDPPVPGRAHFAIDNGEGLIGVVSIDDQLGYWLASAHHGRGYMTEACLALLEWHFNARPDDVVPSGYHLHNAASANVQHKLGFVETGRREMRFVRSQQREVEHIDTSLTRAHFNASPAWQGRM
jgi:RimJ/RimL family protein N-acetyltransferase